MTTVSYSITNVKPEFNGNVNSSIFLGAEVNPVLTTLGDGSFALAYGYDPADTETMKSNIFVARYNADGTLATGAGYYGGTDISTSVYSFYPAITSLPGANSYLAVWTVSGASSGTMFGFSKPLGTTDGFGFYKIFSREGMLPDSGGQSVVALPGNKFAVPGHESVQIFGYDSANNVTPIAQWEIGSVGLSEGPAKLAVLTGGNIAMTYVQSQNGIYNAVVEIDTVGGARILAPTVVGRLLSSPAIVALKDGGFAVAYVQYGDGVTNDLRLAFYSSTGALRGNVSVAQTNFLTDTDPALTVLANGFVDLTWTSGVNTMQGTSWNDNISAAIFDPAAMAKVAGADLETQDAGQYSPTVTALAGGQFATAWTDTNQTLADGNQDGHNSHIGLQIDQLTRTSVGTSASETLRGDALRDVFTGGGGNDRFVFGAGSAHDIITDFTHGQDKIYLANFFSLHSFADVLSHIPDGTPPVLRIGTDTLILFNVDKATLTADDFILARQKADFDGNTHSDLLWQNDNGAVSIWDNGQITSAHVIAAPGVVPGSFHIAGSGDFDGNGKSDILWRGDNGAVTLWDNGSMASARVLAGAGVVPSSWSIAGTGDFDGNSRTDILWQNTDGTVSIWNNGEMSGARVVVGAGIVPSSWHIAGTGDFDGNGQSDILWRNDNGTLSIWDNGLIGNAHVVAGAGVVTSDWHIAGTGDFDGNGQSDILWRNDNGAVSIWDNGAIAGAHVVAGAGVVTSDWHIAGTADFDGNGHSDIVWRNDNGAASIWDNGVMANAHLIAAAGTVPADWHLV